MFVVYLVNMFIFMQNNVGPLLHFLTAPSILGRTPRDDALMLCYAISQVTYTESAISYSVSMSCVLGSRLCLNVRGMVWEDEDIMTGHNTSLLVPSVPVRVEHQSHHTMRPWHVVVTGHSKPDLTEYEMDELRTMRLE